MACVVTCECPAGDICGEGAVWDSTRQILYWGDINRFLLHVYDPRMGSTKSWSFPEPVIAVHLTTIVDTLLLVLAERIVLWTAASHPDLQLVHRLSNAPGMRFNDSKVDARGALWVGTMKNNVGPDGEELDVDFSGGILYRIDPEGTVTEWMHDIGISNTLAWSPDQQTFYFGDTIANTIYAFESDPNTGAIFNRRNFFAPSELGVPDGSAVDAEGCLWNTRPRAGCIARLRPDGTLDRIVHLPVQKPTTCAFGGLDLQTLFITSARSADRLSGSLFSIRTEVPGLPVGRFQLRVG